LWAMRGVLLNQLLVRIGMERKDVFITNVVHYRPPGNRDPLPEELEAFRPYLDKIIKIIDPEVVVTLGRFSMAKFLPGNTISSVHGKAKKVNWKDKDFVVVPMYHPAAGLRNGSIKQSLYTDFEVIPKILKNADKITEEEKKESRQMNLI
jgi:uracil-DNA glycosylase